MNKISTYKPEKDQAKFVYKSPYINVVSYKDWLFTKESDMVVCIPYLIEENKIILRIEYIPTFEYRDNYENFLTVMSGTIEDGEEPSQTLIRELKEELGIELRYGMEIKFDSELFVSKGNCTKYHTCILPLTKGDYNEVVATTDGSIAEQKSSSVKVDVKYINQLKPNDVITALMIEKIKKYLNIYD